jgi:RNA polymerase sigma-70 factor, ECF subfamily
MTTACVPYATGRGRTPTPWVRVVPILELVQHLTLPVPDDAELMIAIARAEVGAFERLYERYAPIVLATCLRIVRDRVEAEDLLEEVFWEIWARRDRYDASRSSPFTYLMTLARSRALDRLRYRKRRAGVWLEVRDADRDALAAASSSGANPFEDAAAVQRRTAIDRALEELPAPHRRVVEMNFFEGLSHREISEQLGDPLGTVKTRIRQGLLTLRKVLRSIDEPGVGDA